MLCSADPGRNGYQYHAVLGLTPSLHTFFSTPKRHIGTTYGFVRLFLQDAVTMDLYLSEPKQLTEPKATPFGGPLKNTVRQLNVLFRAFFFYKPFEQLLQNTKTIGKWAGGRHPASCMKPSLSGSIRCLVDPELWV